MTKSNEFVGVDDRFIPESEKEKMKKADIEAESRQKKVTKFYVGYLVVGAIIFIAFIVFIIMMLGISLFWISFLSLPAQAVVVRGYYKKNGTYVAPHTRTNPDGNKWNNKSVSRRR